MNMFLAASVKTLLIVLLIGTVLGQILAPIAATETGDSYPEVQHLALPYSIILITTIFALQIALLITWQLVSYVRKNNIFVTHALPKVNAIMMLLGVTVLLPSATMFHLLFIVGLGGPGTLLAFGTYLCTGTAIVLLFAVMRQLLITATANRQELDKVI